VKREARVVYWKGCLEKQRRIDELEEENRRLKAQLRYEQRKATERPFGSSTPSSRIPVKANSSSEEQENRGGAKVGHEGHGRQAVGVEEADRVELVEGDKNCPCCGGPLEDKGVRSRTVVDGQPLKKETIVYHLRRKWCPRCRRSFQARAPGVRPKSLYGNQLLTHVVTQHYVYDVPLGRLEEQLGIGYGSLIAPLHRLAGLFGPVIDRLVEEYRQSPVKHADETSWRTNGHNGYVWLFCTPRTSLFRFRKTRSASVAKEVFGEKPLPGTLVVDRYHAYNKAPCNFQYCYSHLKREVEDLQKEFPDQPEVQTFADTFVPLLSHAMSLRSLPISDREFYRDARNTKQAILKVVEHSASHPGIQRIQDIFRRNGERMYRWADDRNIPAENNLAERTLRPTVIARKVSFGSQSDAGAKTREILMSVLLTLKQRLSDFQSRFKDALDSLAENPNLDPYVLLFQQDPSQPAHN
jgi:transposase